MAESCREYVTITGYTLDGFDCVVTECLRAGWELHGSPYILHDNGDVFFHQALFWRHAHPAPDIKGDAGCEY